MSAERPEPTALLDKLRELPPERVAEVEDFVEEERRLLRGVTSLSQASFARVWDNPADAAYDQLRARRRPAGAVPAHGPVGRLSPVPGVPGIQA